VVGGRWPPTTDHRFSYALDAPHYRPGIGESQPQIEIRSQWREVEEFISKPKIQAPRIVRPDPRFPAGPVARCDARQKQERPMDLSIEEIVEVVAPVFGINHDRELTSSPASKYRGALISDTL